jgi:hypothetical protein
VVQQLGSIQDSATGALRDAIPFPSADAATEFKQLMLAVAEVNDGVAPQQVAEQKGLELHRLNAWIAALSAEDARSIDHPLHAWYVRTHSRPGDFAKTHGLAPPIERSLASNERPKAATWNARRDTSSFANWFYTGWAFAPPGRGKALVKLTGDQPALAVPSVLDSGLIAKNLQGAARSPTFLIPGGQVHLHVKGHGCRIRLVVDNFMLNGVSPLLFEGLIADVDTRGEFKWNTINGDLLKYVGERAYFSIEDEGDGEIAVDEIVFSDDPPPADDPYALLTDKGQDGGIASQERLAAAYGQFWSEALAQLHADDLDAAHAELLNWALRRQLLDISATQDKLAELRAQAIDANIALPKPMRVLAMADGSGEDEHVYLRGKHRNLGDLAPRRFLEAVSGIDVPQLGTGSGRLGLAQRIVDPSNPLFARVAVNRIWHHLFGRGIVPTLDNFGVQGESPSHPELLDWLANDFATHGWSQKRLIRKLALSRAYRMSSSPADAESEQRDPANVQLHRAGVMRLEGEVIRDCLLQVSGSLDERMFGESIPAHIDQFTESKFQPKTNGPLDGNGRRSIYLEVRRNYLSPMMLAFDTPTPFTTVGRRNVSNVPGQALIMLNDPLVASLARQWAERLMIALPVAPPEQRINYMFQSVLCRPPTRQEREAAQRFLDQESKLLGLHLTDEMTNNVQAWSSCAHVLFNHKEFVLRN